MNRLKIITINCLCFIASLVFLWTSGELKAKIPCFGPSIEWVLRVGNYSALISEPVSSGREKWIILHDYGWHRQAILPGFAFLSDRYHLIFIDMPGSKTRPFSGTSPSGEDYQKILAEIPDHFEGEVGIIAHGLIGLNVLALQQDMPGIFNKVILINPPTLQFTKEQLIEHLNKNNILTFYKELPELQVRNNKNLISLSSSMFYENDRLRLIRGWYGVNYELFQALVEKLPEEWDYTEVGEQSDVTVIHTEVTPYPELESEKKFPLLKIPQAGHFPWTENRESWKIMIKRAIEYEKSPEE